MSKSICQRFACFEVIDGGFLSECGECRGWFCPEHLSLAPSTYVRWAGQGWGQRCPACTTVAVATWLGTFGPERRGIVEADLAAEACGDEAACTVPKIVRAARRWTKWKPSDIIYV